MATNVIMMELLGRGVHANPRHGCNVLEYASVLAGERWETCPQAVHPALAAAAGMINDLMTDDRRRLLTPLAPWLVSTRTADPRVWPAVTGVCLRAALASAGEPNQPRLRAKLDITRNWLAEVRSPRNGRRRVHAASRRERRWASQAICSAVRTVAISAGQDDADAGLCQVLVDCINEWRRLSGEPEVDPRLPLADCPQNLAIQPRLVRSPGCDWMELGYQLVTPPAPAPTHVTQAQRRRGQAEAAHSFGQARGVDLRRPKPRNSARHTSS
jgi:hypothetical protein